MPAPFYKLLVFLSLLIPINCFAQFTISGRVLNQADSKPVANASVFINNATIGSATGAKGTFNLYNVKPGKYYVIVTVIGFETYSQAVTIADHNITLPDIALTPKVTALKEVVIRVNHNREKYFSIYYPLFKNEFLGTSAVASDCKILNPEILDFDFDDATNTLTVSSDDFLQIENPGLGYKIKYLLQNFKLNVITKAVHYEGPVLFTEMKGSPGQEREWQQNRKQAYEGSNMHFLRSVLNDRLEEDGFRIYQLAQYPNYNRLPDTIIEKKIKEFSTPVDVKNYPDSLPRFKKMLREPMILQTLFPNPLNKEDLVRSAGQPGMFKLGCDSAKLLVDYAKNHRYTDIKQLQDLVHLKYIVNKPGNKELTFIELDTSFFVFDNNGSIADPNHIQLSGVWARNRVGDLLPVNYEAAQGGIITADSTILNIKSRMNDYATEHITEKVHLQLDRAWYTLGDTIWFKAYTVAGANHQLSPLSGALHAELINDKDSVVKRLTLRLNQGVCDGDMILPPTYRSGIYRIRAYTNWMLNDSAYFYNQKVVIGGLPQTAAIPNLPAATTPLNAPAQKTPTNIDLQFFPEGGELVTGLRSKIAFKAIGPNGLSENVSGVITDQDGTEITSFSSQHLGMGEFALTPLPGKNYQAKVTTAGGAVFNIGLPQAKSFGFTLTVNHVGDSIYVKVAASDQFYNNNRNSPFYLIAQSGGKSYYLASSTLTVPVFTAQVEKTRFPSGIVQFTLFSKTGEPLNERIIYVENNDQLKLDISTQKPTYSPHDAVKLNIEAKDKNDNTVAGNFSIAVADETKFPVDEQAEHTIQTDLLLTSDLKGYVENPNYYFLNETEKTHSDLDLLMLTQGYRTFNWKQIFAGRGPKITYEPQVATSLSGTIKTAKGKPLVNRKVRLTSIKDHLAIDTVSDINGHFTFTGLDLSDTTKVILSLVKQKGINDDDVKFYLNEPPYPNVDKMVSSPGYADTAFSPVVKKAMQMVYINGRLGNGIQLKEVAIKGRRRNPVFEPTYSDNMKFSANLNGPGNANEVFLGEKLVGCIRLADCLRGRLLGVQFNEAGIAESERASNRYVSGNGRPRPMALFIDGIQHNPADINNVSAEDIYSIEVLISASYLSIYGSNAPNGALIITLKRGSDYNPAAIPVNGLVTYKVNGFYKSREFYSPKYNAVIPQKTPDDRKTIYWNPNITTGPDGKTSVDYFNAGNKGTYRVVIEGIDADGNLGRQVFRYKVE